LLILTDGAVSDVQETARCIDAIDTAPLSIVIVGIGSADFSGMQFLDDNSGDIDIAQFVEFNKHKSNPHSLSSATLDEIPNQLENYFVRHNIMPNPPVQLEEDEINNNNNNSKITITFNYRMKLLWPARKSLI